MKKPQTYCIDYDDTISTDPALYEKIIALIKEAGNKVYIVTLRYPSECVEIVSHWNDKVDGILPTSRKAKAPHCELHGVKIDIWIDDNPKSPIMDTVELFGFATPEGFTYNSQTVTDNKHLVSIQTAKTSSTMIFYYEDGELEVVKAHSFAMGIANLRRIDGDKKYQTYSYGEKEQYRWDEEHRSWLHKDV